MLTGSGLASLAERGREALAGRDVRSMARTAAELAEAAPGDRLVMEASGALRLASLVLRRRGR